MRRRKQDHFLTRAMGCGIMLLCITAWCSFVAAITYAIYTRVR